MRRQRPSKTGSHVSLSPFLAVLICTMGAIVVLLVIVVQQARVEAHVISSHQRESQTAAQEDLKAVEEDELWRLEVLEESREEKQKELREARLRLAGIEDHARRLVEELKQLRDQIDAIRTPIHATEQQRKAAEAQLVELQREVDLRRRDLQLAKEQAKDRRRSFSIIAYEGPNGTHRRPIFIECLTDRVVIQPEGLVLTEDDFSGPLGPGNPLASALRAIREYGLQYDTLGNAGEPYPLLIVRPNGAESYAAARRAMKSWDSEFGYELIDEDIQLQFPPTDPALKRVLERVVDGARRRGIFLARAAPSRYGYGTGSSGMVLSPQGGFVRRDGRKQSGSGRGWGHLPGGSFEVSAGDGAVKLSPDPSTNVFAGNLNGSGAEGHQGERQEGLASDASSNDAAAGKTAKKFGNRGTPNASAGGAAGSGFTADASSIAQSRGKDWGLPNASRNAIGFTRPIQVSCHADRLVVHPEKGVAAPPRIVVVTTSMRVTTEEFVSAVWAHMDQWGIAGNQSYWKPVLVVEVMQGGEQRFRQLRTLLESSGMEVTRKSR